jgi:ATP-dependent DNA helicase RecG
VLIAKPNETMVQTNDGSEIAKLDLKLRGPVIWEPNKVVCLIFKSLIWFGDRYFALARNYALKLLKEDPMQNQNMQLCVLFYRND